MSNYVRSLVALAALAVGLPATPAYAGQDAADPTARDFARGLFAGFVEAREIDARCDLLEPDRKARFADDLEYLRRDATHDFDEALTAEAEEVGKRYARDPGYLDCGQAAMDRVEDRYERLTVLVMVDKRNRRAAASPDAAGDEDEDEVPMQVEPEAEVPAEEALDEPVAEGMSQADFKEFNLALLVQYEQFARTERRCKFLDDALGVRVLALLERSARSLASQIDDPAALAAVESAPDAETGCGEDLALRSRRAAEGIDESEAMVELTEKVAAMMGGSERREEAAAAADLSVPLPPPPADRPRPLTKAQKKKAVDLKSYARSLSVQRIERRCQYLPAETRARLLRVEQRYTDMLRVEIGDSAAVAKIDAAPEAGKDCGEAQRAEVEWATNVLGLTEQMIETMESLHADGPK